MTSTTQRLNVSSNKTSNAELNAEQLTAVIDAILDGKYSWACVLLLRFAGYDPLHYIPYRTYNRLLKEDLQKRTVVRYPDTSAKIEDLPYADAISTEDIQGGKSSTLGRLEQLNRAEWVQSGRFQLPGFAMRNAA